MQNKICGMYDRWKLWSAGESALSRDLGLTFERVCKTDPQDHLLAKLEIALRLRCQSFPLLQSMRRRYSYV